MTFEANSQVTNDLGLKPRLVSVATGLISAAKPLKMPTMREIASQAGVSLGAAYRHFESQGDLFLAVIEGLFKDLENQLTESQSNASSPREAVANICGAYVAWGLKNVGGYQLLFETTDEPDFLEKGVRPGRHLLDHLASVMGESSTPTKEQAEKAVRVWTSLHGLVSLRNHKLGMDWPTSVEEDVAELLKSLS